STQSRPDRTSRLLCSTDHAVACQCREKGQPQAYLPIVQIRYSTYCCLVMMTSWYHLAVPSESPVNK
ncbi:MAG: hypothetical protein ACK40V_09300, partial [Anaerolineales bacterium]